uniref:Nuclear pore protein n=2 Tax=Hirondellea gigas TaxID=1518452 RepID=A0A6A7FYE9_9CRUS
MASSERSLTELLQAAQHMTTKADLTFGGAKPTAAAAAREVAGEELPRVDRSLAQLVQVGEFLWPGRVGRETAKLPTDHEAHASILLGSRGLDLPHMTTRLTSLASAPEPELGVSGAVPVSGAATAAAATAAFDVSQPTSIAAFLRQHRQNAIVAALHAANLQTSREVEDVYWQQQRCEWEQSKQSLLAAFTQAGNDLLNITLPSQASITNTEVHKTGSSLVSGGLSSDQLAYARVLLEYNKQVLCHGVRPNLADGMYQVAQSMHDQGVSELWRVVVAMSQVSSCVGNNEGRTATHRTKARMMTAVTHHARTFLQEKYTEHMRAMVYSDLARAALGGVPGLVGLVKGYLGVTLSPELSSHLEDGQGVNGAPVWPLLFYCLRAGGIKEASSAAPDNNSPSVLEIIAALQQCSRNEDSRVSPETEKRLRLAYKRSVKTMRDPFKRAVYCVLARCDVTEDHGDIVTTTDDYLWLKLTLVDTSADCGNANVPSTPTVVTAAKQDLLTLPQLQHMLYKQYGESHFNAYEQPLLYTTVLLLTGQFEAAIEFLRRNDRLLCHAVHIAIALYTNRILCVPQALSAPLLSRESDEPECCLRLNLARLMLLYTRQFEATHPHEALHYCFLLKDQKTSTGEDVFLNCISELALHSREFDLMLGKLNDDGTRTPGIVDNFNVDVKEVTELVARDSEKKGLHEDAIRLYDLAKNHEKVISLLNKLLSQVVHLSSPNIGNGGATVTAAGSDRERVLELACSVGLRFRSHGHNATQQSASTMHLLLDLATVFDLYHAHRYQEAVEVIQRLQLIALTRDEVETRVSGLTSVASEVKDVLPSVLLAAITSTYHIYNNSTASTKTDGANTSFRTPPSRENTKHLQGQARAIVTFAGMIPLRLHADVNARLVQLEALIN